MVGWQAMTNRHQGGVVAEGVRVTQVDEGGTEDTVHFELFGRAYQIGTEPGRFHVGDRVTATFDAGDDGRLKSIKLATGLETPD